MPTIDKSSFLSFNAPTRKEVPLEGGCSLWVRKLSPGQVYNYGQKQREDADQAFAYLLAEATVDENGNAFFDEDDTAAIIALPYERTAPLISAAIEFNGLNGDAAGKKPDAAS